MKALSVEDLSTLCAPVLSAFSLSLADSATTNLLCLKNDDGSTVVKAKCQELDTERSYVLKGVNKADYFGSEASKEVENLLGTTACPLFLLPAKRQEESGLHLFSQNIQIHSENHFLVWSVSSFVENAPSFDWLDSHPAWTKAHATNAGKLLAKLHQVAREQRSLLRSAPFAKLGSVIPSLVDKPNQFLHDASEVIVKAVSDAARDLCHGTHSENFVNNQIMLHGDYHPGNVLFANEDAIAVIDWDYAHRDHPLLDIAYGLIMFAGMLGASRTSNSLQQDMAEAFLNGYKNECTRTTTPLPSGFPQPRFFQPSSPPSANSENDHMYQFLTVASALIFSWTTSRQGQLHKKRERVAQKCIALITSLGATIKR